LVGKQELDESQGIVRSWSLPDSQRAGCYTREICRGRRVDPGADVTAAYDLEILRGHVTRPAASRWNELVSRYARRHIPIGTHDDFVHHSGEDRCCPAATCATYDDVHANP